MFETVAPDLAERRQHRLLMVETLPFSIAAHAAAAAVAFVVVTQETIFPDHSPRLVRGYAIASIPDPPSPPPPPATAAAPAPQPPTPESEEIVAPTLIPDTIPHLADVTPAPLETRVSGPSEGPPSGVHGGDPSGVAGGEIGGTPGGVVGGIPDDGRLHVERNEHLPLVVVEQPFPKYPETMRRLRKEGMVTLRYIIGTNGRVKEVMILDPDPQEPFNDAALEAIRQWRFRPMIRDGKPIEVVHELTVIYELILR